MEDDLNIQMEYLSNHLSNPLQILNLSIGEQQKLTDASNEYTFNGVV